MVSLTLEFSGSIRGVLVHQLLAVGFNTSTITLSYCTYREHRLMSIHTDLIEVKQRLLNELSWLDKAKESGDTLMTDIHTDNVKQLVAILVELDK